jgi:hypothetical protein
MLTREQPTTADGLNTPPPDKAADDDLCELLKELGGQTANHERDTLERLLFTYRYLIETAECGDRGKFQTLKYVEELLRLCRAACRLETPDPHLLKYLRPNFNVAFRAKMQLAPNHAKELLEIAWEATRGIPYDKPQEERAVLGVYFADGQCYLMLDAPEGPSRCFVVNDPWTIADVAAAAAEKAPNPLPLPDDVRAALRSVRTGCKLEYRWRDPCHSLGYHDVRVHNTVGTEQGKAAISSSVDSQTKPGPSKLQLTPGMKLVLNSHGFAKDIKIIEEEESLLRFEPQVDRGADSRLTKRDTSTRP